MTDHSSNDNEAERADLDLHGPDSHGQAAMLLIESLLHGLVARKVLSVEDAVEIVEVAAEVKRDTGIDLGDSPATMQKSLDILETVRSSLSLDVIR